MTSCNNNIVSILHQRAIEHGDRLAYIFLKDGTTIDNSFTYKELDRKARAIATALQSQADRGERALLLYSSSEEFLPAFFGCLYAGIIAVPTPALDAVRLKRSLPRLKAIATDSQAAIILTTSRLAEGIEEVYTQIPQLRSAQLLVSDAIDTKDFSEFTITTSSKNLAYLQYTSGSTSQPKGVMISHENAIDNLAYITEAHGYDETSISATWTPFFHDYGLVNGLLLPIYAAIPCYVLSPISFIKKPFNWLKAISRYRVTHSGAPNFAYDYCVDRIKKPLANLDLSSWRVAHTGAETIRRQTLEEFAQTFESCGFDRNAFYPSYGLAEATLMATTRSRSDSPVFLTVAADKLAQNKVEISQGHEKTQVLTGCGYPTGNTQIVIVDSQSLIPCAANEVGEIWVTSKSVAQGYWNRPEETKQIFQANLSNPDASFLRTGDLGFFKYGQLFVAGRLKDLIVIRGKNYYPQDIEFAVEKSHPQLRVNSSAVFSIDVDRVERLVVAAEVDSRSDKNLHLDEIIAAVSHAVAQFELPLHAVVLLKRGSIPKTSSGKIQRHACRNGFLANTLSVISSSIHTQSDRQTEIQEILIQHPNVERVVVSRKGDRDNLIAYIVPTQEKVPTVEDIRHFIDRKLLETETIAFVLLEAIPLKPDGAIDFDALPIPQRIRSAQNYVSPRNRIEQKLANIWAEVLWIEQVSIDDNFFALGGSSLLAVTAIAKIEEQLAIEFTPENLPQLSTIADLTPVVEEILAKKSNSSTGAIDSLNAEHRQILTYVAGWKGERVTNSIVGLNIKGSKQPIFWCLQGFRELSQLAKYLGEEQPIYGMRSGHLVMEYTPENTKALAAIYVEEILSVWSEPYILGGNCQSAWIIWEVAQQLIGRGKTITLLCLMEQFIPQTYSGKIALFFGRESKYNPYKRFVSPELGISKFYKHFSLDVFPGEHGQFFNEPNIQILTQQIAKAIAQKANSQGDRLLPPQAYNAKLSTDSLDIAAGESLTILVKVENISTVIWKETNVSGIRLGNHWLDETGEVVCWCDGVADLDRELSPQAAIDLHLQVTAPKKPGSYTLELDLVEEGITWFKDKGSKTAVVDVEVLSPQPEQLQKSQKINISPEYNLESLKQQGHFCFERGDFESAIAFYQSVIKLAPQQPSRVYQNLGMALSDREDFDAAIIAYNKALELETNNAELYYLLAKARAKRGLLSEAATNYYKAIELEPKPWFYSDLGSVLSRLNCFTEAVEIYDRAVELNDRDPSLYVKLGSAQIKADRPEIGVRSYATAIELNPDLTEVYTKRMGDELCQQGNFEAAISAYRRSLAINPRQHKVYIALGNALSRLNQIEDAIALYREAIALNPENAALYSSLGNARRKIGDRNGAISSYRRSLELNPRQYQTCIALGNTLCKNKNWTEATAVFDRAIKLKPRHFKAYNGFANAQHKQGNLQASLAAYRRCLELNPRSFNTCVAFGNTLFQANQIEEAIEAYNKAIELSPQPPFNIYLKLGDCLSQQGYRAKAIAAYHEAIRLKPNRTDLQNRLAKLVKQEENTPKIPRNLILFWDNKESIPEQIDRAIKKTIERNPDYNVIYADDNFIYEFIQSKYDREVLDLYRLNKIPASRSDLARLMLLYEYGGVYLDAAMEIQTSIDTLINGEAELVLVRRDNYFLYAQYPEKAHITNNIIGSIPRCKLIKETIAKVIDNLRYGKYNNLVWWASGPYSLNCLFKKYEQNYRVRQLYFSQLKDNFFVYRRVYNVSGSWTKQQTADIIDKSYYFPKQEKTIHAYEKAIESQPDNPYLYFSIGKIQAKNKDYSAAIASYQKAIQLDRNYIFVYLDLAKVYADLGCFDRAIAVYQEVIDMQPFLADVYEPLGDAQLKLKEVQLAIASYQKAIELSPQPPFNIYLKLGDCLSQQGLIQDAIASYQTALKLKPNSETILTRIDNLEQKLTSISNRDRVKFLKKDSLVICVLGMHRSGTSCLAGSLQAAGIPGGKVNQYATDNIRGNRENESILALNKRILADNNSAWNYPPDSLNYSLEHQQERDLLVKELSYHPVWMFKDPRSVLTLPFWQEGIANLQPVATFRHPLKVAMSLNRRQESVALRDGLKLWIYYNSLILKAFNKSPFPLICFDLPQPEYLAQLIEVIDELNKNFDLKLAKSKVTEFYESTLIDRENTAILSPTAEDSQFLARAESIYQELREKAGLSANFQTVKASYLVPLEESQFAYMQAIKSQPDNWQLHFMLAKMQHNEGDIKSAIASSEIALKLKPDNIELVEQLSQLLIESERVDEAIILLEQLLNSQPKNPRIYLLLGKIQRQHDRTEAAINSYQKAVELIPYDLTSQVHLGRLLLQNNQNNAAIEHYRQALQLHPQSHQIYFDLGKAHAKQKDWKLAVSNYKKATTDDTSAAVYIHLANAYKQQGNKRQALKTYRQAIASNPNNLRGYVALGNFYRQQQQWSKAIENYQKAISLNCKNAGVYFALGECWRQKRNWTKAIDSFQEALKFNYHKSFELYKVIGDTLTELNEINSAISAYQKAMKINPDSSEVKNSLRAVDRKLNCI